jgi:hypothetical protein
MITRRQELGADGRQADLAEFGTRFVTAVPALRVD